MALRDQGKVYIEVGVNEVASKATNPNIPYGPDEVTSDIVAVAEAGATVVHFHARDNEGVQAWTDDEMCRRILADVAKESDIVTYPSYVHSMEHIWALAERPPEGTRLQFTPFDPAQHVGRRTLWDSEKNAFGKIDMGPNDPVQAGEAYPPELDRIAEYGLVPNIAAFNASDMRWIAFATQQGLLKQPLNLKLFFSDRWVHMSESDPDVIDFLISRLPEGTEYEAIVVPYAMTSPERCEQLWDRALDKGLGIRVGLGDSSMAFPNATNREMVERAVERIQKRGLEPASTADLLASIGQTSAV